MRRKDLPLRFNYGAVAQLGEHLLCKEGVGGSSPPSSTSFMNDSMGVLNLTILI